MANFKFVLDIALLCQMLSLGFTHQNKHEGETSRPSDCPEKPLNKCTCTYQGGKYTYPENSPCYVLTEGYNGENDYKHGTCQGEKCIYTEIPLGCEDKAKGRNHNSRRGGQVGCAFTCYKSGKKYHGFLPEGTPCQHTVDAGKYVNGTCVKQNRSGKVLCQEYTTPPAC
ncbi:uncharacterized protein LOC142578023 isoform X1 [Dermacentor variabilis]|uniref:uncharacterized protein LOC142578023 isoform X1 n=1 Tax=Dermacentor variabilis TaxID=34621 RepID=UPI003F5B885D